MKSSHTNLRNSWNTLYSIINLPVRNTLEVYAYNTSTCLTFDPLCRKNRKIYRVSEKSVFHSPLQLSFEFLYFWRKIPRFEPKMHLKSCGDVFISRFISVGFLPEFKSIERFQYREISVYVSSLLTTMKSLCHYAYCLLENM